MTRTETDESRGFLARRPLLVGLSLALLAALVQADAAFEFRSDDVTLVVQGQETGLLGLFLRCFMRPFADSSIIAFYRPLFSFDFGMMGQIFGDDPRPYGVLNLILQGLAVLLGHRVLLAFGAGARAAAIGTLLFALQPFAVNNVAWLVGRSTLVATITTFGVFLLDRRARRRARLTSRAAILLLLAGMLYRETSAFALVLVALGDRLDGVPLRRSIARLSVLALPVLLALGLRLLVIGELMGGYEELARLRGAATATPGPREIGMALLRLVGAAPGVAAAPVDWRFMVASVLALAGCAAALARRGHKLALAAGLLGFALLHALPLAMVDAEVQAGSSQRWHGVAWALCALTGLGLARFDRRIALLPVLVLSVLYGWRLRDDLVDYERSARAVRSLRAAIARSAEPVVIAHGLLPYIGGAPFFELGAGQLTLPPFGDGKKALYPLMSVTAHGPDPQTMQTPLAARFALRGERMSPLWLDPDALNVVDMPPEQVEASRRLFASRPRLDLARPVEGSAELVIDIATAKAQRIEIHVMTPLAEIWLIRRRGEGSFARDAERYVEDLSALEEIGRHLDGAARGRCYVWITAHDDREALVEPFAVSEVIAVDFDEKPR